MARPEIVLSFLLWAGVAQAAPAWEQIADKDGFVTERRPIEGTPFFELRVRTQCELTPKQIFQTLWRHDEYTQFVPHLKTLEVIEEGKDYRIIYQQLDLPVIKNRDQVVKIRFDIDEASQLYQTQVKSAEGIRPEKPDYIRVKRITGGWTLEPREDGKGSDVTYVVGSDPGGSIPAWMINSGQKDTAPNFVKAMLKRARENVAKGR